MDIETTYIAIHFSNASTNHYSRPLQLRYARSTSLLSRDTENALQTMVFQSRKIHQVWPLL
jgi:hypothetical protein